MKTVLVVEDNHDDRALLRVNLEHHGCRVLEARDGLEGLEVASRELPDLVVSDALMPRLDGFQLLQRMKRDPRLCSIPFLFYSAVYTGDNEEQLALSLGAEAFVTKPCDPEQFWEILKRSLETIRENGDRPCPATLPQQEQFLERYSTIVAAKLEEKVRELEGAKSELEDKSRRLDNLFRSIRDVIVVGDQERRIQEVNQPALRTVFGYELDEIRGQSAELLYAEHQDFEAVGKLLQAERPEESGVCRQVRCRRKDGESFAAELCIFELRDEHGKSRGNIGIFRDTSESCRMEEKLARAEADWEESFDAITDIVSIMDRDLRILRINRAGARTLGRTPEELVGHRCHEVFRGIGQPCGGCPVRTVIGSGKSAGGEIYHQNLGKSFQVNISPLLDEKGEVRGIAQFARDISEQKQLAAQLAQAQKMEAIGTLAGGVAHDFNNLLTAILGYLDLADLQLEPDHPVRDELRQVQSAAQRAGRLIRQLLLFSRKQPMEFIRLDLNREVDEMGKMLRRMIGEDIALNLELSPDCWPVFGDPGNIGQVIMNLSVNARDAMPEGGILTLRTENVELDEHYCQLNREARPGRFVRLTINDTGSGMAEEIRQHIFEPFFTTKERGKGTGLGLAVVYGVVKEHKGWINLYSEPGLGTSFKIYLPVGTSTGEIAAAPAASVRGPRGNGETILVVEDEPAILQVTTETLGRHGYQARAASSAEEALAVLGGEGKIPDLVLSDIVLPGASGIELFKKARGQRPALPFLLMSGYANEKVHWPWIQTRKIPFLEKPFTTAQLLKMVQVALAWKGDEGDAEPS